MPLENRNSSLNSDRADNQTGVISNSDQCVSLLEATTNLASALLSDKDLDRGVNRALEILGKSTEADRLNLPIRAVKPLLSEYGDTRHGWHLLDCFMLI